MILPQNLEIVLLKERSYLEGQNQGLYTCSEVVIHNHGGFGTPCCGHRATIVTQEVVPG